MKESDSAPTRRAFLSGGMAAAALAATPQAPHTGSSREGVDFRKLLSRADLIYTKPAPRSEAGIPIGNGRMGSLVWTTPTEMRFQINRADVYANGCASNSFNERNNDYCSGCAYIEIDFGGSAKEPFPTSGFSQRLSLYDGVLTMHGDGVEARVLGWPARDVIAVSVDDRRPAPAPLSVSLRMLRYQTKYFGKELAAMARDHVGIIQTRSHRAASQLFVQGDRIGLTQEFQEDKFYCKSAVAVRILDRAATPRFRTETEVDLVASSGSGPVQVLIASAASFNPTDDVLAIATDHLEAAGARGFSALEQETAEWWHNFWPRAYVHLHSQDGTADFIEANYHYYLYLMASTSRGTLPPKFNGMIFNTGGDLHTWGAQHWFANLSCYYEALPAANRLELMDPMFDMYSGAFDAFSTAARQQWGSQGIYIPETSYFDGLETLPDDVAAEMQALYLLRKPWAERSRRFMEYSQLKHPHSSRWNWIAKGEWIEGRFVETERGFGPFGNVSHILGTSAKIPYLYWRRYEFTHDRDWLKRRAYPMLKAASEFYRNFPNVKRGSDGKYHIHNVNSNESVWGARDTDEDLSAMRGVVAATIRAAEILGEDAALRAMWKQFLQNLAPLPTSDDPDAIKPADYAGPRVWVRALRPAVKAGGFLPDGNSLPQWFFDLCNLSCTDAETLETATNTVEHLLRHEPGPDTPVGLLSKIPIAAATLGKAELVRYLVPNQMRGLLGRRATPGHETANLPNRMSLREGPQALDAEALGRASEALNMALLQSNPPAPAEDPILHVFPGWPKDWDAAFTLRARGAFLVTSSTQQGKVSRVELESEAGAHCRLRNPWGAAQVTLQRNGRKGETLSGRLLEFATHVGERIVVMRS